MNREWESAHKNRSPPRTRGPRNNIALDPRLRGNERLQLNALASAYASARWRFEVWSAAREVMVETVSSVRRLASAMAFDALLARSEEHTSELQSLRHL